MDELTALEHLQAIENEEVKQWCMDNLDEKQAHLKCYHPAYALMLCVNVPKDGKHIWDAVGDYLRTGHPLQISLTKLNSNI